jgi:hypothetical protein
MRKWKFPKRNEIDFTTQKAYPSPNVTRLIKDLPNTRTRHLVFSTSNTKDRTAILKRGTIYSCNVTRECNVEIARPGVSHGGN